MREYVIIMPRTAGYACEWLRTALLDTYGGYTEHEATGAWKDPTGAVIFDHNAVFTVATDHEHALEAFQSMARIAGRIGDQQSVYLRDGYGNVEFVEILSAPHYQEMEDAIEEA